MNNEKGAARSLPRPPRFLLVAFGALAVLCFLAGFVMNHHGRAGKSSPELAVRKAPEVKRSAAPRGSAVASLVVPFDTKEGAARLQGELSQQGYQTTIRETQVSTKIPSGFVVAQDLNPVAAKPVADTLSQVYHFKVSLSTQSKERIRVQVGPVYKTKAEAATVLRRLKALGFDWKIIPGYTEKSVTQYQLVVSHVPSGKINALKKEIEKTGSLKSGKQ